MGLSVGDNGAIKFRPPFVWVVALAVLLIDLCVLVLGYVWLDSSRQQYQERAVIVSQNIARLLEQSIADSLERAELGLHAVADEIAKQKAGGGINEFILNAFIARQHARLPDMEGITVSNSHGAIRYGINFPESMTLAGAEEEVHLRDNPDSGVALSKATLSGDSRKWIISVHKRYNNTDGSFGGLVSGAIDLDYFDIMFSSLNVGARGSISLRDDKLAILVRYPKITNRTDVIGNDKVSQRQRDLLRSQPYRGTFTTISEIDGVERIYSYQKIGKWPLYVQVGLATEDNLIGWHKTVKNSMLFGALFILLSMALALVTYRYWSERRGFFDEIEKNRQKFRALAELSSDWFWEQDKDFRFTGVTSELGRKYGIGGENYEGKTRHDIAIDMDEEQWSAHMALLNSHQPFYDFEYCVLGEQGDKRYIVVSGEPVFDDRGNFQGYRGVGKDVTDRKRYEERIEHMAQYDSLTNLPNRALFYDRLKQAMQRARRDRNELALLYFDLDKFKPVNDDYGHAAGDQLLMQVASRIKNLLRESDTVARLGGDEFAALLPRVSCRRDAEEVSQKIIVALMSPFALDSVGQDIVIGVSIGVAIFPHDADNEDCLIKNADAAMYKAKQNRNCYHFFGDIEMTDTPS